MSIHCDIYKTRKKDGLYLYVQKKDGLSRVPEALLNQFVDPEIAMSLMLNSAKKLARTDVVQVMFDLAEQGYHLQLPPSPFAKQTKPANPDD